jgi:hypothetical protein
LLGLGTFLPGNYGGIVPEIGIIGNGIGALHLALLLQQKKIPTVLYMDRTVEEIREFRLTNTVRLIQVGELVVTSAC